MMKLVEFEASGWEIPQQLMHKHFWSPFEHTPKICLFHMMKSVSGKTQKFWHWDCCPQVQDFQDFQIKICQISGILLYIHI
jgi:hypothetical protein